MKQKYTKNDVLDILCINMGGDCDNCPYYRPEGKAFGHCNVWKEVGEFFSPIISPKEWVETTYNLFVEDEEACGARSGRNVVVIDVGQKKMEVARCREEDEFDGAIGAAIAYARLRGLPVHPEYASKKDKVLGRDD